MESDITKIYEEYSEQMLYCQFHIAEKLQHHAEMGRCGENILIKSLQERYNTLSFVTGFITWGNFQSPQCDVLVCKNSFYKRKLENNIYLVDPNDCLMVIEVKGNAKVEDISGTLSKNYFFRDHDETKHIKLAFFAYKTRIGKRTLYKEFGYQYDSNVKAYLQGPLETEKMIDYFVCLHRNRIDDPDRSKQLFFLKDTQNKKYYVLDKNYPVMQNFCGLLRSMQD